MRLILLHSPLAGPSTWTTLAPVLRADGHDVIVPDYTGVMRGEGPYYPAIIDAVRAALRGLSPAPTTFVAHSGAGALLPSLAENDSAIFADALIPHPGRNWFDTAPAPLKERLTALVKDGRLPPWHRWWPDGAIETMIGDKALHETFIAGANDLPLAYFNELAPVSASLPPERVAYLQLSDGYAEEARAAQRNGWRLEQLPLHHLAMLTHPNEVAQAIPNALAR